ncbi:MAG: PVC-type heme-binding CxxCH protein, partial [Planctomycetota bacterium]
MRLVLAVIVATMGLGAIVVPVASRAAESFAAKSAEGRPLNLDFETGDLRDWNASGAAFARQPVRGDTVQARRSDSQSRHRGEYWIGTYEFAQDAPVGELTSAPFDVTHPYASFLVGGGHHAETRVEIVDHASSDVLLAVSGQAKEDMSHVAIDLRKHHGKTIVLRLIDNASGGWGHVNFDHFRFHAERPDVPMARPAAVQADDYPHRGLTAEQAVAEMRLPEGFSATVFAAEPDVKQPIAMAIDDRGRVWIAEAYEYPRRAEGKGRDRILIFTDNDGDGQFDERKIFAKGLNLVSGLEVGFGGVWVGAAPYLLFIPDRDGNDVADGEPEVLLDGWGYQDTHETLNAFIWGPDGWLYGCHGVFTHSLVGKPGAPEEERTPLNAGVWRYHPTRREFEVFAHGTSNPWGVDFDDHGQAFCTACVIPHLFHMIQGARYHRQAGRHFNPHTYDDIKTIADHLHYLGATPHSGNDRSDQAGGGHAHAGAMIYLGDAWPPHYRGQIFMNNIHGQRLNVERLKPQGSGFVGSHEPDFLLTRDRASQMLNFRYGPDGNVYVIDWYDMQACHDRTIEQHDRSNGRIYKVVYGDPSPPRIDIVSLDDRQLVGLCLERNDWYVRHARRILQERSQNKRIDEAALERMVELATSHAAADRRLRALWALHVTGELTERVIDQALRDRDAYVRGWALQLAMDDPRIAFHSFMPRVEAMAQEDESQVVRLYLASAAGRLPLSDRWDLLAGLVSHGEDADDRNLPLMYWYAAEPLAAADPARALALGMSAAESIPLIQEYMARRIGGLDSEESLAAIVEALGEASTDPGRHSLLSGMEAALRGRRRAEAPENWQVVYELLLDGSDRAV